MPTSPGEQLEQPRMLSNLTLRLLTAAVALPVAIAAAYLDGWLMVVVVTAVAAIGVVEFYILEQGRQVQGSSLVGVPLVVAVIVCFYLKRDDLWLGALAAGACVTLLLETVRHPKQVRRSLFQLGTTLAGVLYVAFPLAFLIRIRGFSEGWMWSLLVLIITWGTDTGAYFGGRLWGKTKLAPRLSPKKTVEGAVAGWGVGSCLAAVWLLMYDRLSVTSLALILIGPLMAMIGDLAESAMKRFFQVKDSHITGLDILPGHGGVLDRIDSLLFVSTFSYLYFLLTGLAG